MWQNISFQKHIVREILRYLIFSSQVEKAWLTCFSFPQFLKSYVAANYINVPIYIIFATD